MIVPQGYPLFVASWPKDDEFLADIVDTDKFLRKYAIDHVISWMAPDVQETPKDVAYFKDVKWTPVTAKRGVDRGIQRDKDGDFFWMSLQHVYGATFDETYERAFAALEKDRSAAIDRILAEKARKEGNAKPIYC